uniref:tRNA pseudouridine(65) synthase TruC n=1 Tax=Thaumasiovibrio occultus TaxID=1891184 RepID=UPI00131D1524|nr:tRNA pseudouridine(65) synthase TruC [Thaumasiovibrio occultus]
MATKERILQQLDELNRQLEIQGFWQTSAPSEEKLQSTLPFAVDTLTPTEWLQWIFLPRMQALLAQEDADIPAFSIAPYFEEALKGQAQAAPIIAVCQRLDDLVTPLEIVYRDEHYIAVNKPAGMLVHRSWLDSHETRFAVQTLRDQIGQHVYPVHRLDRPTSGVLLFGLSKEAASKMMPLFAEHQLTKTYHAVVRGWINEAAVLDYPLKVELDKIADKFASQEKEAQSAITHYRPLAHVEVPIATGRYATSRYCLVEMEPQTGRKHQLRRHMHHLSHHIIGDVNHGDGRHNRVFREHFNCHRLMLHASRLAFIHPFSGEPITIEAKVDETWLGVMRAFEWEPTLLSL